VSVRLDVVADPARECAALLTSVAAAGGQIALAGGSTPRAAYEIAAENAHAWASAVLWFGDERCVPPDDERSNFKMAKQALLDPLASAGVTPDVRRIEGERGLDAAADAYDAELLAAGHPALDLVLLGLGPDGHTLSMFPDHPELAERSRWAIGVPEAGHEPFVPRVSLTFAALAACKRAVFLIAGEAKAAAVAAAFGPDARPDPQVPASLVADFADDVLVLLDPHAASQL
jgi:6-phosphogluconolactonase